MSVQLDWTEIKGIRYRFEKHTLRKYSECHSYLNLLSSEIDLPPSIYLDTEKTTVVKEFAARIKDDVVEEIISILTDEAPATYNNDFEHIASLFKNSRLVYQDDTRGPVPIRSTSSFTTAASKTIAEEKDYIEIFFTINNLHFDRANFEYVSLREPQAETSTDESPQDNPTTNANQDQAAAMTAIANQMEQMQVQQGQIAQMIVQTSITRQNGVGVGGFELYHFGFETF